MMSVQTVTLVLERSKDARIRIDYDQSEDTTSVTQITGASRLFVAAFRRRAAEIGLTPDAKMRDGKPLVAEAAWTVLMCTRLDEAAQTRLNLGFADLFGRIEIFIPEGIEDARVRSDIQLYLMDENGDSGATWFWRDSIAGVKVRSPAPS